MRTLMRLFVVMAAIVALSVGLVRPARADGVVGNGSAMSCTDDALTTALTAGGTITFNCGGAATIHVAAAKTISMDTTLEGGNLITLSGDNVTRLFVVSSTASLVLNNITLTNGYDPGDGGAILNDGTLILANSTIQYSTTDPASSGGAIASYGPVTLINSVLAYNSAGNGGALYPRFAAAQVLIVRSSLHDNHATNTTNGWGGAILLWDGATLRISGGDLSYNTANVGGGIYNGFAASSITMSDGAYLHANIAERGGGGIYNAYGTASLVNVTLEGNATNGQPDATTGPFGGGLHNSNGTATLTNVTFAGNSALFGGGLYNFKGTASLTFVTFAGNSAPFGEGAALFNFADVATHLSLKNVVLADSVGSTNCQGRAPDSAIFSLSTDTSCPLSGGGDLTNTPALLGTLQDNGGGVPTILPQPTSPLIDHGQCPAGVAEDERALPRPQGATCDMGAVEVQPGDGVRQLFLPLVLR